VSDGVYEARYGWNRQAVTVIGGCLAFCLVAVLVPMPLWVSVPAVAFFGAGGLALVVVSLARRPALRVDASGVTTYPRLLSSRPGTFYPWDDVTAILIWQFNRVKSVGVVCREGAGPQLGRPLRPSLRAALALAAPGIPGEVAAGAVSADGWVLRTDQLGVAVARFAPDVRVIDTTTGQRTRPGGRAGRRWRFGTGQVLWACGVVLAVCFMYLGASYLGPALRAAHGQGVHGTWVAQQCVSNRGSCTWYGRFVLPDGTVTRPRVMYGGSLRSGHAGLAVPALDAGASDEVYPPSGSKRWVHDLIGLVGGAVAFGLLIGRWAIVKRRRRMAPSGHTH
jgi:hypothetical protein